MRPTLVNLSLGLRLVSMMIESSLPLDSNVVDDVHLIDLEVELDPPLFLCHLVLYPLLAPLSHYH